MESKIGFIGLGIMGKPMARNLIKAGYSIVVYDLNAVAVEELNRSGAEAAASSADVASGTKIIITMLPNGPEVREVITGRRGIAEGALPGTLIIDMSSIAPGVSQEMQSFCKARGLRYMDAPVSGGEPKAIDGTLAIMAGCDEDDFEPAVKILKSIGSSVVRTGMVGSGNVTKLANQIVVALNIAAISEAYVLAAKAGVDPAVVFEAIRGGLAGSTVMNAKTPMILKRNFDPGFKLKLHIKDLNNAIETGHNIGVPLPLTSSVMEIMQALNVDNKGENDHSVLVQYFEKLAKKEVSNKL